MEPILKYLMQNYHILGVLVIVMIIAVKLFMTTRQAKKMISESQNGSRLEDIAKRLERIELLLDNKK